MTGQAYAGFPTTAKVYESVNQGGADAFAAKFTSSGSLAWSTFVGGAGDDYGYGIAADPFGNSYISGLTYSTSFLNAPQGGAQPTNRGNGDAFVTKLNFNGSGLLYFTFLGGSQNDQANAIAVDATTGIAVVGGQTSSADLPTTPGVVQTTIAGAYDGFVAKLNATGSAFLYTTYLGGNRQDHIQGVAVDPSGNAYVAGWTDSNNFPANNAIQSAIQGNSTYLFRTSNKGASWTPFDTNLPGAAHSISPDPVNASMIVVSTEAGIYRTTNGGGTWTQQSADQYAILSRSPANPSTIYALNNCSGTYQSTDNGITWSFRGFVGSCASGIVADPINAATAYMFNTDYSASFPGVQKTIDNGVNWSPSFAGVPGTPFVSALAAGSDGSLYAGLIYFPAVGSFGGVYKSTDHGATWAAIINGLYSGISVQSLAVAASNPSIVYVTDGYVLFESTNAGALWGFAGFLPQSLTSAFAISATDPTTLYSGTYDNTAQLWTSTNSGGTWSPATSLGVAFMDQIVPDPLNAAGAYALASFFFDYVPIIAKIDAAGRNLIYSTYLGDNGSAYGIATNGTGDAFITGFSSEFPTTPSALQQAPNPNYPNLDAFAARISDATATCSYSVDPQQSLENWIPHYVQYVVTAPSGCTWTASSNQPWATVVSGASGAGSGIVYVLADNTASST